jgi:hypothetical protein
MYHQGHRPSTCLSLAPTSSPCNGQFTPNNYVWPRQASLPISRGPHGDRFIRCSVLIWEYSQGTDRDYRLCSRPGTPQAVPRGCRARVGLLVMFPEDHQHHTQSALPPRCHLPQAGSCHRGSKPIRRRSGRLQIRCIRWRMTLSRASMLTYVSSLTHALTRRYWTTL